MAEISIPLNLNGPAITPQGYPLEEVNAVTLALASLIKRQMDDEIIRGDFEPSLASYEIRGTFPRYGSFEQQLVVLIKDFVGNHPLLTAAALLAPQLNSVFTLYDNIKKHSSSKSKVEKAPDGSLIIAGEKEPLRVDLSIFEQLVDQPEFRQILDRLSPGRIDTLELGEGENKITVRGDSERLKVWRAIRKMKKQISELQLDQASTLHSFGVHSEERAFLHPLEITGIIRAVDLDSRTGRVRIEQGAEIAVGDYHFVLTSGAKLEDLQNHVGGRARLFVSSLTFPGVHRAPTLTVNQITRLGLAGAGAT